jgi:hypothetical protein
MDVGNQYYCSDCMVGTLIKISGEQYDIKHFIMFNKNNIHLDLKNT